MSQKTEINLNPGMKLKVGNYTILSGEKTPINLTVYPTKLDEEPLTPQGARFEQQWER